MALARRSLRVTLAGLIGRKPLLLLTDLMLAVTAMIVLQFGLLNFKHFEDAVYLTSIGAAAALCSLYLVKTHMQVWRCVSLLDLLALVGAAAATALVIAAASFRLEPPPAMGGLGFAARLLLGSLVMLVAGWSAPRLLYRLWEEWQAPARPGETVAEAEPVLLYGSGPRADQFIRVNAATRRYDILGLFHENRALAGRRIRGVVARGSLDRLGEVMTSLHARGVFPKRLIVTEDRERPDEIAAALEAAAVNGLRLARLPSLLGLLDGFGGDMVRPVAIEDILNRGPVRLGHPAVESALAGATVMVTGAGGSIGSELVRQIAGFRPARIVLVDQGEFNLYEIDMELGRAFPKVPRAIALCDVRDAGALRRVFARHRPAIVLHAAALKHVPMLEHHPEQAVLTNVLGTRNVALLSREFGVKVMTLVSTDKAVNPTNVMGCTKRWAEIICQTYDRDRDGSAESTRFVCVRFGNVLDSAGSVLPLFRKQIARGGPVTVTHRAITRYFMTIPEACELILTGMASTFSGKPAESQVYVLDMGEPVRIYSLAEQLIQLHGLRPHEDIEIRVTGLRAGEKLHEELAHDAEHLMPASFPKASLARARATDEATLTRAFDRLIAAAEIANRGAMLAILSELVPEFAPDPRDAGESRIRAVAR